VRVEELDGSILVLDPGLLKVYELTGPEAEAFRLARSGTQPVPEHLMPAMAALVHLGVVEAVGWDRRRALLAGGAVVAAGISLLVLPSVAAAASAGGGGAASEPDPPTSTSTSTTTTTTTTTTTAPTTTTTTIPVAPENEGVLTNSSFTSGTTGWSAPNGFQTMNATSGNRPAVDSGQLYLSYSQAPSTVSQTVSLPSITSYNQVVANLRIANVNNYSDSQAQVDQYYFSVDFRDSGGILLRTLRTPSSGNQAAPAVATIVSLTLTRASFARFDSIATATVTVSGYDGRGWAGNYGPIIDYITLVPS
jgi:hypothetical protein